jgi:hypothetical protein
MSFFRNPLAAMSLAGVVAGEMLPYNPSRILLQRNSSLAYIFEPSQGQPGQSRFLSLDLSQTISTDDTPFTTNSDTLPFLEDRKQIPFTPVMDTANGHIVAVTGDCAEGAEGIKIYTLSPDEDGTGNGTWKEHEASDKLGDQGEHAGANFLSAGMAFSGYTNGSFADSTLYLFGGMCPFTNSTADDWASKGNYSNMMLTMSAQNPDENDLDYEISLAPGRGPPIAEAGFTITGLPPTFSNANDGSLQYQQQDFVLLGGHTQTAFINMSQVALFSLPQESWTFLPVKQPASANTELAVRQDTKEVEPRSGHTAVLSEDGASVIVFGGWVGDISTPAQPQLAIMSFGAGFGGRGGWTWTVPEQSDNGLGGAGGLFGHGATMLPGGIMMIVGGYSIPAISSSSDKARRDTSQFNEKVMLFNTTSNSWIQSYTKPVEAAQQEEPKSGALHKSSQKAGLGVGLTFGVLLLVGLVIFYFWYIRKLKRQRESQERLLATRASDNSFGQPFLEKGAMDNQQGPSVIGDYWQQSNSNEEYPWLQEEVHQLGSTTGSFSDKPSPTRGLRKGVPQKNYQYHAAPRYDESRMSRGSGQIHPIAEHEDEDSISRVPSGSGGPLTEAQRQLREVERVLAPQRESKRWSDDPFRDPEPNPLGSHPYMPLDTGDTVRRVPSNAGRTVSPQRRHNPFDQDGVPNWTIDHHQEEPLLFNSHGRISPTRSDERTSSTLSDQSHRSTNSSNSITRTMSTRTGAILAAATAAAAAGTAMIPRSASRSPDRHSFYEEPQFALHDLDRRSPHSITRARTNTDPSINGAGNADAESFKTARTSFVQLQAEGEALLGGRRDDPYHRASAATATPRPQAMATSSAPAPAQAQAQAQAHYSDLVPAALHSRKRPQGLIGSIRRAIGAISTSDSRSFSLTAATTSSSPIHPPDRSASSSPNKFRAAVPRRAASDGGYLLRQKRGRKDWQAPPGTWEPYRDSDPDPGDWGPEPVEDPRAAEEDWDVEDAAAQRDVQVMFTVPKTRLRVVNDDMDRASLRSASDGMLSRSGSTRTEAGLKSQASQQMLKREGSRNLLRVKSEGNARWLDDMAENKEGEEEQRYRD